MRNQIKPPLGRLWLAGLASVLLLPSPTAQAQSSVTNGLVAYWNFDGKNYKDSVGIFEGTENGTSPIAFVPGKSGFGQAIQLDGTDQMVEITGGEPDDLAFAGGSVSIAAWFKVGTFDKSWQALVAKGEGSNWRVARNGSNPTMSYAGGLTDATGATDVTDGNWHHLVAISDADGATFGTAIYVDGNLDGQIAGNAAVAANGSRVIIGDNPGARGRYWNGAIDDVAIWNRVLTEAEISALYAGGAGKPVTAFFSAPGDADADGMPDAWETKYGLNPKDASDAAKDLNGNGISNLDEYKRGLDPTDTTKPVIVSAVASSTFDSVKITFSKELDPATASNAANYAISPSLAITAASYKTKVVILTTAAQAPGATAYTVTVNNVKDINNWPIAANTKTTVYSYMMTKTGVLKFSYWGNISGTPVDSLISDPRYPATPDLVGTVFSLNSRDIFADDSHENYGATLEGYLTPTVAGSYRFFVYSDDASQLFLSTDDKEANLVQIAEETGCCNAFTEPDSARTSEPIALKAGTKYFIRLIYKEGGGGDYGQVAWRMEGDKTPAASLRPIPGKYLSSAVDLPAPAEGKYLTQTPAPNAKNVSPATSVTIAHSDGKTAWTAANVTLKFDGVTVTPTFTKDGNTATIVYKPATLLPSKTKHFITLGYSDPAGKAATSEWSFETTAYQGQAVDVVNGHAGLIIGNAQYTPDAGGHTAKAGDYAIDFGSKGGAWVDIADASFLNDATKNDEMSFSFWVKKYDIANSSAFWANSASAGRGFQAHTPWSDNSIYFDTMGCCDATTQRINAPITDFSGYTGTDAWWQSWHHFVFMKKADQKNIYIDGKLFLNGSSSAPLAADFTQMGLGTDGIPGADFMHGLIDDFAVFATGLSAADAAKLAGGTSPKDMASAKLLAYWDFNGAAKPITVTSGLTAYWNFDGNLQDSIKNFHGTAKGTNALAFVDGMGGFGKAIKLDGTDQYVDITGGNENELEFPKGSMSIAGWFKVDAFDRDWQALIAKGEGTNYRIARRGSGNSIAYAGGVGEGADDVPSVNDGQWHHFVAISDAKTNAFGTALYIDGVLHGIMATQPVLDQNAKHLFIGANPDTSPLRFWKGEIDDIAIWNRVVTADEVATLWNSGLGTPLSTLPLPKPPVTLANMTIVKGATAVTITFEGTLQSADAVTGPWTDVAGASPQSVTPTGGQKFYRSKK